MKSWNILVLIASVLFSGQLAIAQEDKPTPTEQLLVEVDDSETTPEVISALIKAGADVNARDIDGWTPLMFATNIDGKNSEVISLLLEAGAGAKINARSNLRRTPLILAAKYHKNTEVISLLIEAGADVNARDIDGWTPLMFAMNIGSKNSEVISLLIEAGADVNARNNDGESPLMYTSQYNTISLLLEAGANVNARSNLGQENIVKPLDEQLFAACQAPSITVKEIERLLASGADVNVRLPVSFEGDHRFGKEDAPVQIVVYVDYQSPDCKRMNTLLTNIMKLRDDVSVLVKHFPLHYDCNDNIGTFKLHGNTCWAARAAEAASTIGGQEAWKKMHTWLFENGGSFTNQTFKASLSSLGFTPSEFIPVMMSEETDQRVKADANVGADLGVFYTPMVTINGEEILWHQDDAFSQSITSIIDTVSSNATNNSLQVNGWTPLMVAVKRNTTKPKIISTLLDAGADINAKNSSGLTPLMIAIESDPEPGTVSVLVDAGADINGRNQNDWTPLMLAVSRNMNPEILSALTAAGANVDARFENELTPLMVAVKRNTTKPKIISTLLDAGADINAKNSSGLTPLMIAIESDSEPGTVSVLVDAGADINGRNQNDWTPLMLAVSRNMNPEIFSVLIDAGAIVDARFENELTPLIVAARRNTNPEVVSMLIRAGAVLHPETEGKTLLMEAAQFNQNPAVLTAIINAGVQESSIYEEVNARHGSLTPLMFAARYNPNPKVLSVLINAGAKIDDRTNNWFGTVYAVGETFLPRATPLMQAARYNPNPEVLSVLIKAGADVNARTGKDAGKYSQWSGSALHLAAAGGTPEVVSVLINAGAEINARCENKFVYGLDENSPDVVVMSYWTPLMIAVQNNENSKVISVLLNAGADAHATEKGKTALDMAMDIKSLRGTEAMRQLIDASN